MRRLVHVFVRGKVQGVGYRAFVERQAELLDLEGWVRNRRDGSVELVAAGTPDRIENLLEACRKGPPAARVTAVETRDAGEGALAARTEGRKFAFLPKV